jgi:RHS repeat-associated protein
MKQFCRLFKFTHNTWVNLGLRTKFANFPAATVKLSTSSLGTVSADAVRILPAVVTTSINYIFTDHLNTPRVITRANDNQIVWRWDQSDPFGVKPPNENPSGLGVFTYNPRFPGQLYDAETGLYYNYHRNYDPKIGSYTQSDPIGLAGGINTYAYVGGNPVNFTDPFGLVKHTTGRTISCGKCTIRIDYTFDEKLGVKTNHLHWNCKGKEGSCGENGEESHGGSWDDAPENVKQCARESGFLGASSSSTDSPSPKVQVPAIPWWTPLLIPAAGAVLFP